MPTIDFEKVKIHDPIHKTIGLSELEVEIVNTRAFQRLRNIKQLGLVNYVFPGADYTRFSHSIGVCHLSGQLYDATHKNGEWDENEKQKFRLAGLLHDIGHYPFSHAMEEALGASHNENLKETGRILNKISSKNHSNVLDTQGKNSLKKYIDHESVGRVILSNDQEINKILSNTVFRPNEIFTLFARNNDLLPTGINLISSDLDADRLDYLLRSAYHVGLPYGSTDLEYILSQMKTDSDKNICISYKALRTVDHFLLCRYFDYSQVIFHKTVAGFEETLKKVIKYLIQLEAIKCSEDDVVNKIKSEEWYEFDDQYVMSLIKKYFKSSKTPYQIKLLMKSIIKRDPPKEIVKLEYINETSEKQKKEFLGHIRDLEMLSNDISSGFSLHKDNIFVWHNGGLEITKIGRMFGVSKAENLTTEDSDKISQTVRIYDRVTKKSVLIMDRDDSLMNVLSGKALYSIRLFVMLESGKVVGDTVEQIRDFVTEKLPYKEWK